MSFPGADFALESVSQITIATVRVRFTQDPKVTDPEASDDALNPINYTLTGPELNYVIGCSTVPNDTQAIDCFLAAPLIPGDWSLSVANIKEDQNATLIAPTTMEFTVEFTVTPDPLGHGAQTDPITTVIRKFLNPTLKGKGWNSMIAALAAGDQVTMDNAVAAFDQVFLSSASGLYLQRRASDQGVQNPPGVNMSDDLFRQLAIVQKTKKLTQEAILEVLEVFYGVDAVRASLATTVDEAYPLTDGMTLEVLLDERVTVVVNFTQSHFSRIGLATAVEVAAEISRAFAKAGSAAYATTVVDPETGKQQVRIYSGARGLSSSVRIVGGQAQTALRFPTSLFTVSGSSPFAVWNVAISPTTPGNLRFTETSGIYDLFQVQQNDLAYIYGPEFGVANCNGTFTIEAVSVTYSGATKIQWFEIANPEGVAASAISQVLFTDLMFFRPTRTTIYNSPRHVIVCESGNQLDIVIPATTQVVNRGPGTGAYLNVNAALPISSLVRQPSGQVTVTTTPLHELSAGDQIIIDGVVPSGIGPTDIVGTPSGDWVSPNNTQIGITDASPASTASQTGTYQSTFSKALVLQSGDVMIIGGQTTGPSVNPNMTIFQKTDETFRSFNGGYQQTYQWTQIANDSLHGFGGFTFGQRYFAACVLANGDVLAAGGGTGDDLTGTPSNGWDRFTFYPPTTIFQQSGNTLPSSIMSAALGAATNGKGVFTGGWTVAGTPLTSTYLFDPSTNTWSTGASMGVGRFHHQLTPTGLGTLLASGGYDGTNPIDECEVYDPTSDTWTTVGNMSFARYFHATVELPDGRIVAIGGIGRNPVTGGSSAALATAEIFDPTTGQWSNLPSMRSARDVPIAGYSAQRNCIIVAGGTGVTTIEYLDIGTMKWTKAPVQIGEAHEFSTGCITRHSNSSGTPVQADTFLIAGGDIAGTTDKKNYVFVLGADGFLSGTGLNRETSVASVIDGHNFTYDTSDLGMPNLYTSATTGTVTAMGAEPAPANVPGPFSYNKDAGLAITDVNAVLAVGIPKGQGVASIPLVTSPNPTPAVAFPDQVGYLVFNFGFENQVGPVRYFGQLTETELILDAATVFPVAIPAGSTVRLLFQRTPWEPAPDALVGNFYLTGTAAGRVAAQQTIDNISPAGKNILITVIYPSDRGLGAEGFPQSNAQKLSDKVEVWGGDQLDQEIPLARLGEDT